MKAFNKDKALRQIKLKQNKNTYIKKVSIVLSCFILIIGIIMFTFAKFEQNSEEYTLINGKIKYLGGNINIVSYNYDGTSNSLPPNKNEGYILTNINCEGATGEWDDVNWELNISSLTNKVKCNLEFDKTSNYQIIKYNPNGGYLEEQYKKGVVGEQIGELPTPIKTGYTFAGWYKEETLTNKVETTTIIDQTITDLYAKYTENTITINTLGESNVLDYAKANFTLPSGYVKPSGTYNYGSITSNGSKTISGLSNYDAVSFNVSVTGSIGSSSQIVDHYETSTKYTRTLTLDSSKSYLFFSALSTSDKTGINIAQTNIYLIKNNMLIEINKATTTRALPIPSMSGNTLTIDKANASWTGSYYVIEL